jgi:hypothetical protein
LLIDEFSTQIYPAVDDLAGVQSIVDYHGTKDECPGAGQAPRLIGCETLRAARQAPTVRSRLGPIRDCANRAWRRGRGYR